MGSSGTLERPFRSRPLVPLSLSAAALRDGRLDGKADLRQLAPMKRIALCVPFARKDEARRAGARWDTAERVWTCDLAQLKTEAYERLRPFVPRMYRPELDPPFIRPWMVPQTAWGRNLRAVLVKEDWDVVRKAAYQASGYRCRVCGGKGEEWPVEADEGWHYDDALRLQTLKGVIALCPDCHKVRHWGKTLIDGHEAAALVSEAAQRVSAPVTAEAKEMQSVAEEEAAEAVAPKRGWLAGLRQLVTRPRGRP